MRDPNEDGGDGKNPGNDEVRQPDGAGFANAIRRDLLSGHRGEFGGSVAGVGEDERRAKKRSDDGADSVERLREIKPADGGFRRAENGDVGIGGDFEEGLAASHQEKSAEKIKIDTCFGGRNEK